MSQGYVMQELKDNKYEKKHKYMAIIYPHYSKNDKYMSIIIFKGHSAWLQTRLLFCANKYDRMLDNQIQIMIKYVR